MRIVLAVASLALAFAYAEARRKSGIVSAGYMFESDMIGTFPSGVPLDSGIEDDISNKIFEGKPVSLNDYPFIVYLNDSGNVGCTGTLLSRRYVLTSINCAYEGMTVVLGDFNRNRDDGSEQEIGIDEIIVNPDNNGQANGTVLLKLSSPADVKSSDAVDIIQIVDSSRTLDKFLANERECVLAGWGYTQKKGAWTVASKMRAVDVVFVNETELFRRGYGAFVSTGHIGMEPVYEDDCEFGGACFGDEGAPVICKKGKTWVQVGMYSYYRSVDGCVTGVKASENLFYFGEWINSYIVKS